MNQTSEDIQKGLRETTWKVVGLACEHLDRYISKDENGLVYCVKCKYNSEGVN